MKNKMQAWTECPYVVDYSQEFLKVLIGNCANSKSREYQRFTNSKDELYLMIAFFSPENSEKSGKKISIDTLCKSVNISYALLAIF